MIHNKQARTRCAISSKLQYICSTNIISVQHITIPGVLRPFQDNFAKSTEESTRMRFALHKPTHVVVQLAVSKFDAGLAAVIRNIFQKVRSILKHFASQTSSIRVWSFERVRTVVSQRQSIKSWRWPVSTGFGKKDRFLHLSSHLPSLWIYPPFCIPQSTPGVLAKALRMKAKLQGSAPKHNSGRCHGRQWPRSFVRRRRSSVVFSKILSRFGSSTLPFENDISNMWHVCECQ